MKTLTLNFDKSNLLLSADDSARSSIELSTLIIKNVIVASGKSGGLSEEDRRKYYKISDIFELAVKDGLAEVSLEDDWFGLIKKCFRDTPLSPSNLLRKIEENISNVKDR